MCEIYSKLIMKTPEPRKTPERRQWRRSGVFIVNFEQISHIALRIWVRENPYSGLFFHSIYANIWIWIFLHNVKEKFIKVLPGMQGIWEKGWLWLWFNTPFPKLCQRLILRLIFRIALFSTKSVFVNNFNQPFYKAVSDFIDRNKVYRYLKQGNPWMYVYCAMITVFFIYLILSVS